MSDASPPRTPVFERALVVAAGDLDERAHVNNVVYLRWVQDVATAHWEALASAEVRARIAWVALRHEIDYLAPGRLDDAIVLRTWVGFAEGLAFERFTEVTRPADGKLLARARTLWCPIDAARGRPRRVDAAVRALVSSSAPSAQ